MQRGPKLTTRGQDLPRLLREARASLEDSARIASEVATLLDDPLRGELLALVQDMRRLSRRLLSIAERFEK